MPPKKDTFHHEKMSEIEYSFDQDLTTDLSEDLKSIQTESEIQRPGSFFDISAAKVPQTTLTISRLLLVIISHS